MPNSPKQLEKRLDSSNNIYLSNSFLKLSFIKKGILNTAFYAAFFHTCTKQQTKLTRCNLSQLYFYMKKGTYF